MMVAAPPMRLDVWIATRDSAFFRRFIGPPRAGFFVPGSLRPERRHPSKTQPVSTGFPPDFRGTHPPWPDVTRFRVC